VNKQNQISKAILEVAKNRGSGKTTCPSEIARMLFPENWREEMEQVRDIAVSLQLQGRIVLTQRGKAIGPDKIKGPIRIKIV